MYAELKISVIDVVMLRQRNVVRCDFYVPLRDGKIQMSELLTSLPTIRNSSLTAGCKVSFAHIL